MSEWQPIETAPNNLFDVVAKYWDAALDVFAYRRVCDCALVNGCVVTQGKNGPVRLDEVGLKATHWMHIPELPPELEK